MGIPLGAIGEVIEQGMKASMRSSFKKEFALQKKEHPNVPQNIVAQISMDHVKLHKEGGFYGHSISGKSDCFYSNVGNKTGNKRV